MQTPFNSFRNLLCGCAGQLLRYIADTLETYSWSFGDGTTSTSPNPVHFFQLGHIHNQSELLHDSRMLGCAFPPDTIVVYPKPHASYCCGFFALYGQPSWKHFIISTMSFQFKWIYGAGNQILNNGIIIRISIMPQGLMI